MNPGSSEWRQRAACRGHDTGEWFGRPTETSRAVAICAGCPVRAECLHDCMREEVHSYRFGIRGGLTAAQRRQLPEDQNVTIAALRRLLDERTPEPMTATPAAPAPPPAAVHPKTARTPELVTTSSLLRWAENHPDPDVRTHGARVEAALDGLRQRHAADQELTAITAEAAQLERRLAELRAREAELAPTPKKSRAPSPSAEIRTWAREQNIPCPKTGRIPAAVADAWHAAQQEAGSAGA